MGHGGVAKQLATRIALALKLPEDSLTNRMKRALDASPQYMVELKPCWLWAFLPHLKSFTHATYTDFDIVFGRLDPWLTYANVSSNEVTTLAFEDDSWRVFLRGQFSLFRLDSPWVLLRFLLCDHLSTSIIQRLDTICGTYHGRLHTIRGSQCPIKEVRWNPKQLISAEGCFSCAVLSRPKKNEFEQMAHRLRSAQYTYYRGKRPLYYNRSEVAQITKPLSINVVEAMFTDHSSERVWWIDGSLFRCDPARMKTNQSCISQLHQLTPTHPLIVPIDGVEVEKTQKPCNSSMGWIRRTCESGALCLAARKASKVLSSSLLRRWHSVSIERGDSHAKRRSFELKGHVAEAAAFHYRVWADERDPKIQFRDSGISDIPEDFAVGVDGFAALKSLSLNASNTFDGPLTSCNHYGTPRSFRIPEQPPQTLLQFFGPPRSGSSFLATFLDAHHQMVVANELDALRNYKSSSAATSGRRHRSYSAHSFDGAYSTSPHVAAFSTLAELMCTTIRKCEMSTLQWNDPEFVSTHPNYSIPQLAQGKFDSIRVLGTKKVGHVNATMAGTKKLVGMLHSFRLDAPDIVFKFIFIVRNPYDQIATCTLRKLCKAKRWNYYKDKEKVLSGAPWRLDSRPCFDEARDLHHRLVKWSDYVTGRDLAGLYDYRSRLKRLGDVKLINYDSFVLDVANLRDLLTWLGVDSHPPDFLQAFQKYAHKPTPTAHRIRWDSQVLVDIKAFLAKYPATLGAYARHNFTAFPRITDL